MAKRIIAVCSSLLFTLNSVVAEDWPMWRHDPGRTAVSSVELPKSLALSWTIELPQITPAFHNARLQFDAGYEPIVASGRLLVASSRTDSVTAFDTKTGEQLWKFYTNGPVRFAPAVWEQSVCFGSDDGHLYCLDLNSGKLRWKYQAVPSNRRLWGNQRLISVWPVRGGPVVADGNVYFAAGVWPFEGVFVYAMNIESGEVIWRNDRLGYIFGKQPHNTQAIGGLAPQGYLVVDGDKLIVPCSTAYPALLNRTTGELIEFELPGPGRFPGGWFAAIDQTSARNIRRGKIAFDDVINRQQHEDKVYKGYGVSNISRKIRAGETTISFDNKLKDVDGTIHSVIAADDRMFVTTREGGIHCFKDSTNKTAKPKRYSSTADQVVSSATAIDRAEKMLAQTTSPHGYAIVVGLQDGLLVKAILRQSKFHVIVVDDDEKRIARFRHEFDLAQVYGPRVSVIESDLRDLQLPPYIASLLTTESPERVTDLWAGLVQTLRPYGGVAALELAADNESAMSQRIASLKPGTFTITSSDDLTLVHRKGPLPGATEYSGNWKPSEDALVRFPLGVLWFDDTLAHFKRSPQPRFVDGVMISRPKDWNAPRTKGEYKVDYPLLPPVLSDIYTGRVLDESEYSDLRASLSKTDPGKAEPSQYRPPRQKDAWKPDQPVAGERKNPLTGETEPRTFPKTYGCDGGVDYGSFYTLRAGTPAFYDKTAESGTVFLSGPRSGCTNSIIPAGGLLNVPYFFEGCTCSYPLPTAMSLVALPEQHEQWSAWGETEVKPNSIERIGLNFGAPGDRITREGTLWLDYPSVGGPSPGINVDTSPPNPSYGYRHSVWMNESDKLPWVSASVVEGIDQVTVNDLKPGKYLVRLYFSEPENIQSTERVQNVSVQGQLVLKDFDVVSVAGAKMTGITREFSDVDVDGAFTLNLAASKGQSLISGIELIREK